MNLIKRLFNRKQLSSNQSQIMDTVMDEVKVRKNSSVDMQSIITGDIKDSTIIQYIEGHRYAGPFVDQKINDDIEVVRKSRFFVGFDTARNSLVLVGRLVEGELSSGSNALRCRAIAWCSRFLSLAELDKSEVYLKLAKTLGNCPEIEIADAFICSQKGDKQAALSILANLNMPLSRSAALMIVAHHEGSQGAISWLNSTGINAADLDSDGRYYLLTLYLQLELWDEARSFLNALTDEDQRETPALNQIVAITHLISAVPNELRTAVLDQVPFEAARFPLSADEVAIDARRAASHYFVKAFEVAQQLNCPRSATLFEEYALWLELRDPIDSEQGMQKLKIKLRDSKSALSLVHLGLQFGIKVDLSTVEREIERQIALNGGITYDAAIARFALAFTQKKPEDVANYIARHLDELANYYDKKSLIILQIEMLSQAGMPEKAKEFLDFNMEEGLSEVEENRLRRIIAKVEGINPIESKKEQFRKTDALGDLVILVEELETRGEWDELCEYGEIMFSRTRSLSDAERLATALTNTQKYKQLVEFLRTNSTFLAQSKSLQMFYCWSLYNEGALLEARSELSKLRDDRDNPNYRALEVNLGIALGDWNSLVAFVANECLEKDMRSAQELISVAQLAHHLGSPEAKELTFFAANKGNDDAGVLAAAYFLAVNAGWEDDAEVSNWLSNAAALSGEDGPIQKKSLKDLLNMKPEWESRVAETWQQLSKGEIPMFLAAECLNKSLIQIMLFPALANMLENDPRRKGVVPAYSGNRQLIQINNCGTVAMDASALLTLSLLKLLDKALDAFSTVYIPHSTLKWLFEEKQKATFHQPSRIKAAWQIHHLLATGVLEKLLPKTIPDGELSTQVGDELALLISEAKKDCGDNYIQRLVVRPYPVHRIASLMEEEADLTEYTTLLSSCLAVVEKLRRKGLITAEEEKKARDYLQLHEKPWPNQPEIADGSILYLEDLAINYFLHLGILEKLSAAGFRLIASPSELSEANELIRYQAISEKINNVIENIRSEVNLRIESGHIKVGRRRNSDRPETESISEHPTLDLFALACECDERLINHHNNIEEGPSRASVFSTLDLLDMLLTIGSITVEDLLEYRTRLRQAGYIFVSVSDYELAHHLEASIVKDNQVIETAELNAIRENILRVRMGTWLQIPKEAYWLDTLFKTFIRVLKGLWSGEADFSSIRVRSNWIMSQIDVLGWAHSIGSGTGESIVNTGRGEYIMMLLLPPIEAPREIKGEYWNWFEETILAPIKEEYPDLYYLIIEWCRTQIAKMVDMDLPEEGYDMTNSPYVRAIIAQSALRLMPPLIHETLVEDADFRSEYGLSSDAVISLNDFDVSFQRSKLYDAVRIALSNALTEDVTDMKGQKWELKNISKKEDLPKLTLSHGEKVLILPILAGLSSDSTTRLRFFEETTSDVNLHFSTQEHWRNVLSERMLKDEEVDVLNSEFHDTPVEQAKSIRRKFEDGKINISSLVPASLRYFERLVGLYDGSASIRDYATGNGRVFFEQLSAWRPYDGFMQSLLLSSHSSMTEEINVDHLGSVDFVRVLDFLDKHGDRISQLGAIEIGLRVIPSIPEIEPILMRLIEQLRDDDFNVKGSGFHLISALFMLVDGELSRARLFSKKPPFYRRLAAMAQVALIHRQLIYSGVNIASFCEWVLSVSGTQCYLQSLADMRSEPYWYPDLAVAPQIKADFLGRIMITAGKYKGNIINEELYDLIFGNQSGSINLLCEFPYSNYPGPLEGTDTPIILPAEISDAIETQLSAEEVTVSSFTALLNSSLIFRIGSDQAELAAKSLKRVSYRFPNLEDRSQLLVLLHGLATVAAITRSRELADELRILARIYRRDAQYLLSIDEVMRIYLVAASSREDLTEWRDYVGDCLVELAFGNLEGKDGKVLHSYLQYLCHIVPELWVSSGRADAALLAFNART